MRRCATIILFLACQSAFASSACLRIGLLGEFKNSTGSFSQPFGNEIKSGTSEGFNWLKTSLPGACLQFQTIDIDNSLANIDGYIRKASADGIDYFIGLGTSDQALAAKRALNQTKSTLITPTASATELLEPPSRTVMMFPGNDQIAKALAQELHRRGVKRILSVFASNNKYSTEMNNLLKYAFEKNGGRFEQIAVRAGRINLTNVINRLHGSNQHYVFLPLFELDAAKTITELSRNSIKPFYVGTDAWGTYSSVIRRLVRDNHLNSIIPMIYDPDSRARANEFFTSNYIKSHKKAPTDLAAFSFDAVLVAFKLFQTCGNRIETNRLPSCLGQILPIDTTTGRVTSANGLALQRRFHIKYIDLGTKP